VRGIVLTVGALGLSDRQSEQAIASVDRIHEQAGERREQIDRLAATAYLIHSDVSRHLALAGSCIEEAKLQQMRDAVADDVRQARKALAALRDLPLADAEREMLADIARRLDAYAKAVDEMNQMAAIDRLIGIPMMSHVDEQFKGLTDRIIAAQEAIGRSTEQATQATRDAAATARAEFALVIAALLAGMVAGGLALARSITRPMQRLSQATAEMAAGHLGVEIHGTWMKNEIGAMARAPQVF